MNTRSALRQILCGCLLYWIVLTGCHKPEQPEPYSPCAGKSCGSDCTLCPPGARYCPVEDQSLFCNAQGACVPSAGCDTCDAFECPEWYSCLYAQWEGPLCYNTYHCGSPDQRECPFGSHCDIGACEPDDTSVPECGGPDGLECPGEGTCIDDPDDDCNPDAGTSGCPGRCQCLIKDHLRCFFDRPTARASCWNDSPSVCGCGPIYDCAEQGACCQDPIPTGRPFSATPKRF